MRATTLHSLCFSLLNSEQAFKFTHRTPRPLLSFEIDCLEADLAGPFGGKRKTRKLLEAYEAAWARLQRDQPGFAQTSEDQQFETALLAWLRFYEAMLIGELVPLTLAFLRANPAVNASPQFEHVLVDEYQDLNKADQELVRLLADASALLVTGDDNQSIYSFRHANPEGIRSFPSDVAGTKAYTIEQCQRCPPNIVAISNALISHDPHTGRPEPLKPDATKPSADIWMVQHLTLDAEINSLSEFIDYYLQEHPDTNPGQVLVLAPRRFVGNAIKDSLIARGRNALSFFQEDSLDSDSAAEGFCLLSLLVNPNDRAAIRAWLGFGSADHRTRPAARLREHCVSHSITLVDALNGLSAGSIKLPYSTPLKKQWELLQTRLGSLAGLSGLPLVDVLWPSVDPTVADIRVLAARIALDSPNPEDLFFELLNAITQPELPGGDSDVIQIMSLHKSKGLSRDVVVIAGCMAGTLPFVDEDDSTEEKNASIEEQRRLFYVAITRAKRVLVISAPVLLPLADALRGGAAIAKRIRVGRNYYASTSFSPFVSELGASAPPALNTNDWRKRVGLS